MPLRVTALAESPLVWARLPRLRPTAGLAYEKHVWAADVFEGVPGLALRRRPDAPPTPPAAVDRVALDGPGLAPLVAGLFDATGAVLWTPGATIALHDPELRRQGCRALLEDPRAILLPPPPPSMLSWISRWFPFYPDTLRLDALLAHIGPVATALASPGHPIPGIAVYRAHAEGDLAEVVARCGQRLGISIDWADSAAPIAAGLGLPRFADLPPQLDDPLDLSGFDLAELPAEGAAAELILDHTAVVDLEPLRGWRRLRAVSLRGLEIRALDPVRGLSRLVLDRPDADLLRELSGPHVEELVVHDARLDDLAPLGGLTNLRALELHDAELGSLSGIEALGRLERLRLDTEILPPLDPLREASALGSLALRYLGRLDARSLPALSALSALELAGHHGQGVLLEHPAALAAFGTLRSLDLSATDLTETAWLGSLSELRRLVLAATDLVELLAVPELHHLEHLDVSATPLAALGPLGTLGALRSLDLSHTSIQGADLARNAPAGLQTLVARGSELPDLQGLARLGQLRTLVLGGGSVGALRGVEALSHLEHLDVWGSPLDDPSPLAGLPSLATLDLADCKIASVEVLTTLPALRSVDLSRTQVRDLSPLRGLPLHTLALAKLHIDDPSLLAALPALRSLDLSDATLPSLDALQGSALRELCLRGARFAVPDRLDLPELQRLELALTALPGFEPFSGLSALRELRAAWMLRRPDPAPLLRLPPLAHLELDRSRVRGEVGRALALRHRLILQGE